jgi:Protein of unknown function (DUF1573)
VKRALLFLIGAFLLLPAGAEEAKKAADPDAKGPRISVEPPSFDFGKAVQNKTLSKEFSIKNYGTEDLVIENVSTTCGCTAALLDSKVVKPGGTTPLRVTLETRTYSGKVERKILIRSNDAATNLLAVKVEAMVGAAGGAEK